jgi:hypothetical protein
VVPATGGDGYYQVTVSQEGEVRGSSPGGTELEDAFSGGEVSGTITPPEEAPRDFTISVPRLPAGEYRWIFLDGELRGAKKGGTLGIFGQHETL